MRGLKAIRLSKVTDDTTSPERQDLACNAEAARRNIQLLDEVALDLDVSASKVSPFKRPQLGPWLNERNDEFDALLFWRLDRAVRSMSDLNELLAWAKEHKKLIIFCEGPGSDLDLDMTKNKLSPITVMILTVVAFAAELESMAISERVTSTQKYLRQQGLWRGGPLPYGRIAVKQDGGGWKLARDPQTYPILREIVERTLEGESALVIAHDLNERGIPTWTDPDGTKGRRWSHATIIRMLKGKDLLGEATHNGEVVRDEAGKPILRSDPLVTEEEWASIQAILRDRAYSRTRVQSPNLVLDVAFCAACGQKIYKQENFKKANGVTYRYYHCFGRTKRLSAVHCTQKGIPVQLIDERIDALVVHKIGDLEVKRKEYRPGEDNSEELTQVTRLLDELEEEQDLGLIRSREIYLRRKQTLMERYNSLSATPIVKAGWNWVSTGKTYAEVWPDLDASAKRQLLLDAGLRIYLGRGNDLTAAETALSGQYENATGRFGAGQIESDGVKLYFLWEGELTQKIDR